MCEVRVRRRAAGDALLVLGCDGVWDVISSELAAAFLVHTSLRRTAPTPASASASASASSSLAGGGQCHVPFLHACPVGGEATVYSVGTARW